MGKPYTASLPSGVRAGNPDSDGRELTNVFVIAPTDNTATDVVQPATPFWDLGDPVTLMVDLGQAAIVLPVSVRECFSGMGYGWLSKQ